MSEVTPHDLPVPAERADQSPRSRDQLRRSGARAARPRTLVPVPDPAVEPEEEATAVEAVEEIPAAEYLHRLLAERALDDATLRLRELTEIERMRDLEIARLEQELAEKSSTIFDLETALYHARRRGDDLDRRWNELALTYEETAARLVEAGGRLEAIERQAGYRAVLRLAAALRARPFLYRQARAISKRIARRPSDDR